MKTSLLAIAQIAFFLLPSQLSPAYGNDRGTVPNCSLIRANTPSSQVLSHIKNGTLDILDTPEELDPKEECYTELIFEITEIAKSSDAKKRAAAIRFLYWELSGSRKAMARNSTIIIEEALSNAILDTRNTDNFRIAMLMMLIYNGEVDSFIEAEKMFNALRTLTNNKNIDIKKISRGLVTRSKLYDPIHQQIIKSLDKEESRPPS